MIDFVQEIVIRYINRHKDELTYQQLCDAFNPVVDEYGCLPNCDRPFINDHVPSGTPCRWKNTDLKLHGIDICVSNQWYSKKDNDNFWKFLKLVKERFARELDIQYLKSFDFAKKCWT